MKALWFLPAILIALWSVPAAWGEEPYDGRRANMVEHDIKAMGVKDPLVLGAMSRVPRHLFVPGFYRFRAYGDFPLPIGEGQTISQPYVVAIMTELLALKPGDRILEIGTGSGYQAAVLAEIVKEVYTIEIREGLARKAQKLLSELGYRNIGFKRADGYYGWAEHGPFDAIIITAAANHIPPPLLGQLKEGGSLILPLGRTTYYQVLTLVKLRDGKFVLEQLSNVAFVPMVGKARGD